MRGSAFVGVASGVVPALAAAAIVAGQAGQGSDGAPAGATPTSSTVVRIAPAEQSVTVGDGVQVDVLVDDVSGLGAYEFRIA
ncbi:MAG: hypothetical protein U1B78_00270 [Dehalococcoidia bacterium]|nr:hypothetical protein [Dehalococcoidia bacterium]